MSITCPQFPHSSYKFAKHMSLPIHSFIPSPTCPQTNTQNKKKNSPSISNILTKFSTMQSSSFISSPAFPFHPFSSSKAGFSHRKTGLSMRIMASWDGAADQNSRRRLVDESMIVLRKRIHEMRILERNYEPPEDWMEWEKRYYTSYDSMICEALGVLQTQLMNTRPSLALGMIAVVVLSVPTSTAVVLHYLMEMSKVVLAGTLVS